jgi:outer membrane protein W
MRPKNFVLFGVTLILICLFPLSGFGQDNLNYLAVKGGIYSPTGDLDDFNFDSAFNGEVAYGRYFNPNFAMEIGAGYFKSDASISGVDPIFGGSYAEEDEIKVIPIILSGKGIYPSGNFELYGEIGIGIYLADFEGVVSHTVLGTIRLDDNDTVFGVNLGVGANYNITKKVFIGVEGKYILTTDAEFQGTALGIPFKVESDLNGFILTGNLGFRF